MKFTNKKKKGGVKTILIVSLTPLFLIILAGATVVYIVETPIRILKDIFTPKQVERMEHIKKKMGHSSAELGRIALPLDERYMSIINSPFGNRIHPKTGQLKLHTGVDLGCPTGSNVYAMKSGKVIGSGWASTDPKEGYGKYVIIMHDQVNGVNFLTVYAHLSEIHVKNQQKVKTGQIIGLSGNTGASTGPHLHFEIRLDNQAVDPMPYLEEFNSQEEENLEDIEDIEKEEVFEN